MKLASCSHLQAFDLPDREPVLPRTQGCEECLASGDRWVHLRLCLACGHVGCCNDSPKRHASAHYHASEHPVIRSFEPGEDWAYCYVDDSILGIPPISGEIPSHHIAAPHG